MSELYFVKRALHASAKSIDLARNFCYMLIFTCQRPMNLLIHDTFYRSIPLCKYLPRHSPERIE